jgi:hypothetical protein
MSKRAADYALILTMAKQCASADDIAAAVKCTKKRVWRVMRDSGLTQEMRHTKPPADRAKPGGFKAVLTYAQPDGPMRVTVFCDDLQDVGVAKRNYAQYAKGDLTSAEVFYDDKPGNYIFGRWVQL